MVIDVDAQHTHYTDMYIHSLSHNQFVGTPFQNVCMCSCGRSIHPLYGHVHTQLVRQPTFWNTVTKCTHVFMWTCKQTNSRTCTCTACPTTNFVQHLSGMYARVYADARQTICTDICIHSFSHNQLFGTPTITKKQWQGGLPSHCLIDFQLK